VTDLLERAIAVPQPAAEAPPPPPPPPLTTLTVRAALAALGAAAGVIHLALVPSHMQASGSEGAVFLVAGWAQIATAVALAARATRPRLWAAIAVNLAVIAMWADSRIWGLPFGAHPFHAERVAFVDLTATGMEVALVLAALALVARPALGARLPGAGPVRAALVPVAVLALATAALASPSAADHAATSHGDHGNAATDAPDDAGGATAAGDDGHMHEHDGATDTKGDDNGFSALVNGHQHDDSVVPVDDSTQAQLAKDLALTATLVQRYPTLADASNGGYRRAGPFSPGLGTHMMPPYDRLLNALSPDGRIDTPAEAEAPFLIYDGITPEAPLAGFMFYAYGQTGEPEGFVGPNDHWHYHTNTCIVTKPDGTIDTPLGADREVTKADCDRYGGMLIANTGYMLHVWNVPGYESPDGLFSELNPKITCPDGGYETIPIEELGTKLTMCRS
jgi:hypothetical protein